MTVLDWLLDGDPAIRWQTLRHLVGAPAAQVNAERARVANEGWGKQLLALQDEDGQWAGGAYFPADFNLEDGDGQPSRWNTLRALRVLKWYELDVAG